MTQIATYNVQIGGEKFVAVAHHTDQARWELEQSRNGYPAAEDAPVLWSAFMCWSSLSRAGVVAGDFDTFLASGADISPVDEDEEVKVVEPFPGGVNVEAAVPVGGADADPSVGVVAGTP